MRRWLLMTVLVSLVLLSAGCGAADDQAGPTAQVVGAALTTPPRGLTAGDVQRIGPAEAKELLDAGTAILYDARSADEYRTQRAAGAISFPEADVDARYGELPAGKDLIFY